jgi:hypothetical protein
VLVVAVQGVPPLRGRRQVPVPQREGVAAVQDVLGHGRPGPYGPSVPELDADDEEAGVMTDRPGVWQESGCRPPFRARVVEGTVVRITDAMPPPVQATNVRVMPRPAAKSAVPYRRPRWVLWSAGVVVVAAGAWSSWLLAVAVFEVAVAWARVNWPWLALVAIGVGWLWWRLLLMQARLQAARRR